MTGMQEYADCGDLSQRIKAHRDRAMPEELIWHYAIQMCQARHCSVTVTHPRRAWPICTSAACCTATSSRRTSFSTHTTTSRLATLASGACLVHRHECGVAWRDHVQRRASGVR